jgi:hypothetical protein
MLQASGSVGCDGRLLQLAAAAMAHHADAQLVQSNGTGFLASVDRSSRQTFLAGGNLISQKSFLAGVGRISGGALSPVADTPHGAVCRAQGPPSSA